MTVSAQEINEKLGRDLPGAIVQSRDLTGTSDHFEVSVISEVFEGKSPIARHRLVYSALGEWVQSGAIHALSIRAFTPSEWSEVK